MKNNRKKIGIITFHNSYNCGSMLESYAIQTTIQKLFNYVKIINFSNSGQKQLYAVNYKNNTLKNFIKNILIFPAKQRLQYNNKKYEEFKNNYFNLTDEYGKVEQLDDKSFDYIIAGSDQIWNITIPDADKAYFLPWVKNAKKIAYAPSFGAKEIRKNCSEEEYLYYKKLLLDFDALSIRENNGKKWLKSMLGKDVPVVLDPTLLLKENEYLKLLAKDIVIKEKYIFFYSPNFDIEICKFIKKVADKYNLKVITWSTKSYYVKGIKRFGFQLAEYENPSSYLYYIKNAEMIFTTSYHGTIFSTIFKKNFYTIKNGGMYGDDDRVRTLLEQIKMNNRLISFDFSEDFNYLQNVDYKEYDSNIEILKNKSMNYIKNSLGIIDDEN